MVPQQHSRAKIASVGAKMAVVVVGTLKILIFFKLCV
jgi:hypothetical protein